MKKTLLALSLGSLFLFGANVYAVNPPNSSDDNKPSGSDQNIPVLIENPFKCGQAKCNLVDLFTTIVDKALLPIGGALAVLAFIWSGFMFVTAQGNPGEITKAKTALLYTAIGTAILLGAVALTKVITGTINTLK